MSVRNKRTPKFKTITLTASATPIEAESVFYTFWLQAPLGNAGDVTLTDPDDGVFLLPPGSFTPVFEGVDLNQLRVSGTVTDTLQLVGFTPWS